jgi:hypothetical protein
MSEDIMIERLETLIDAQQSIIDKLDKIAYLLQMIDDRFQKIEEKLNTINLPPQQQEPAGEPATPKQLEYLRSLGAMIPPNLTKKDASKLIDYFLAQKRGKK